MKKCSREIRQYSDGTWIAFASVLKDNGRAGETYQTFGHETSAAAKRASYLAVTKLGWEIEKDYEFNRWE